MAGQRHVRRPEHPTDKRKSSTSHKRKSYRSRPLRCLRHNDGSILEQSAYAYSLGHC
jgi:hypothetical protein